MEINPQLSLTLLRHGLSTANQAGIVQGQLDYPLHETGIEQARRLGQYWIMQKRNYDLIFCSPLRRALETATLISSALSIPIIEDPIWMERQLGDAEGMYYEQLQVQRLAEPVQQVSIDEPIYNNGESELALLGRASKAVRSLLQLSGNSYLVVSHGAFLSATLRAILDIRLTPGSARPPGFRFDNTGFTELTFDRAASRWQIHSHNSTPHMEHDL